MAEKRMAARKAKSDTYKSQVILIEGGWKISRLDERNWQIKHKSIQAENFYASIVDAFNALPVKMLSNEANNSLEEVLGTVKDIRRRIIEALKPVQ